MAVDPAVQQVLAQNGLLADALYDLTKAIVEAGQMDAALIQDAKTKVNALNPDKYRF